MYKFFLLILLFSACSFFAGGRKVRIILDPRQSGWYFIEAKEDSLSKGSGEIVLRFGDTVRMLTVHVPHINGTILSPVSSGGEDLSGRLQFNGIKGIANNRNFFLFYNPTDEQLKQISNWLPTDPRVRKILDDQEMQFDKCLGRGH